MKTLAILCNIVLLGFTFFVLAIEGAPKDAAYILFTLLLMLIPIFTVFALIRARASHGSITRIERLAAISNIILLGFIAWALVDQYPHPEEEGVLAFAVLTVLTPILSAVVLSCRGLSNNRRGLQY